MKFVKLFFFGVSCFIGVYEINSWLNSLLVHFLPLCPHDHLLEEFTLRGFGVRVLFSTPCPSSLPYNERHYRQNSSLFYFLRLKKKRHKHGRACWHILTITLNFTVFRKSPNEHYTQRNTPVFLYAVWLLNLFTYWKSVAHSQSTNQSENGRHSQ